MNKNDLRAQRTFHKINKNFKILMSTIGYHKLNVAMITDKASMNRSTFYSHFADKRELYEYHLGLIIDSFDFYNVFDIIKSPFEELDPKEQEKLCQDMAHALQPFIDEKEFILAMLEVEDIQALAQTYISHARLDLKQKDNTIKFKKGDVNVPLDLIVNFGVGMFVSVIKWWLLEEPTLSPREIGDILLHIFYSIPLAMELPAGC